VLPVIKKEVSVRLCNFVPDVAFTYCGPPLMFWVEDGRRAASISPSGRSPLLKRDDFHRIVFWTARHD
jgi:hypothetical protein